MTADARDPTKSIDGDVGTTDWVIDDKVIHFHTPNPLLRELALHAGDSEPETLDWLRGGRPDEVFYDIGASNGIYALFASVIGNLNVIAFEPEAQNYATLEMNFHLNRSAMNRRPRAFCAAISSRMGFQDIYCARYGAGYHMKILGKPVRVNETESFDPAHVQSVLTFALDDLAAVFNLPVPNLLKIDVDGAEELVIDGGASLLRRPELRTAMIELVEPEGRSAPLVARLAAAGLRLAAKHQVRHLRGGHYEGLFNCIFERGNA